MNLQVGLLQINTKVGDFEDNVVRIYKNYREAVEKGADIVMTPEMALSGYPVMDAIEMPDFVKKNWQALGFLAKHVGEQPLIVGHFRPSFLNPGKPFYNAACVIQNGKIQKVCAKTLLPTYGVFDEARHFQPCPDPRQNIFEYKGIRIGMTICEDIWNDKNHWMKRYYDIDPVERLANEGIDVLFNSSASPWHMFKKDPRDHDYICKERIRYEMLSRVAREKNVPVFYVNSVGGNDELVFDGQSMVFNSQGQLVHQGAAFQEENAVVSANASPIEFVERPWQQQAVNSLVLATRDYVYKSGFKKVVLGESGGIDSALTSVIAVQALGKENVLGVMMPSKHSSEGSRLDAEKLMSRLGMMDISVPINKIHDAYMKTIGLHLRELEVAAENDPILAAKWKVAEENVQARIRGNLLMFLSNAIPDCMVLTTGNKSEMGVGYTTLYGDMAGGYGSIPDIHKPDVYALAEWINKDRNREIIPRSILEKDPSAELSPDQKDEDTLPPYIVLAPVMTAIVEHKMLFKKIVQMNFDPETVESIETMIARNEYKRRQAPPGARITTDAFCVGRRMPLAAHLVHVGGRRFSLNQMPNDHKRVGVNGPIIKEGI